MKKLFYLFTSLVFVFSFLLFLPRDVFAKVVTVEKGAVTIEKDEVVDDDLFVGAESVEINGTVNGNVYAGAASVRVNGTINGSLHAGASVLYLSGTVSNDVYVGAGNVIVSSAQIGNSLHVGAGTVNIDKNSSIGGSVIAGAGSVALYAPVERNVMLGAGAADLDSQVGGEVRIAAGDISIGPDTKIAKDLYYVIDQNQNEIKMSDSASVSGMVKRVESTAAGKDVATVRKDLAKGFGKFDIFAKIVSFLGALLIGFLWLRLYPNTFTKPADFVTNSFFKSLGTGFLVTILAIPALIIMAITMVGLPLAGLSVLVLLFYSYLGKLVVGMSLGKWISNKMNWKKLSNLAILALGLLVIYLLREIRLIGFITGLLVFWSGMGALLLYSKSSASSK